jgi:hypothetical protein
VSAAHVDATFYVQIEPEFHRVYGEERVRRIKAVGITQQRPERPRRGVVVTKLTIRLSEAAFLPLRPEAIVVVPDDMTSPYPIEVEAGDPS